MKTKQTILKAFASVALAVGAFASADAQNTLGADCGCPLVSARQTINLSTQTAFYTAVNGTGGGTLSSMTLTCDKIWILDKKFYVGDGQTLTIEPGTVIKGNPIVDPTLATALVIARGGKINAAGTKSCPIVFTASADPMDGTYGIQNTGKWGGIVILGKASNNLTLAANGPFVPGGAGKLAVADGLGTVEGFASSYPLDQYGVATTIPASYVSATSPASTTYTFDQAASGAIGGSTITVTANGAYVLNGMPVSGTGIAPGATVVSVSSSTVTLSLPNTAAVTGNATFTGTYPLAASTPSYFWAGTAGTGIASTFTAGTGPLVSTTFTNSAGNTLTALVNYAIPFAGTAGGTFDDNDNSGCMTYVSIRHSGAILSVGAEINGLTLASVGRGTKLEHIEIVSCADDNIELFGGTVNLKWITTLFGNDDMLDYDLGWSGKCQFFYGMKNTQQLTSGPPATFASPDNDNGIEADSYDNSSNNFRSKPIMFNMTFVGNGKTAGTADNRGVAGAQFKEGAEGELYNSIFANFKNGVNLQIGNGTARPIDTYESWNSGALKIKCNSFVGIGSTSTPAAIENNYLVTGANALASNGTAPSSLDITKFLTTDKNVSYYDVLATQETEPSAIPGFSYAFVTNGTSVTTKNDVTPNPALTLDAACPSPQLVDNFFSAAPYRGAFSSAVGDDDNWLSDWSYAQILGTTSGISACPTDIDKDGDTDVSDFLDLISAFGTTCN